VAFGGHANAFERFAVSQVLRLGSGRRLPRGLRRPCRRLPLVRRADPGKKPGGIRVRPLSRADRTALGPTGRSSGSLGTGIASRIEAGGVNQSQVSRTGGPAGHSPPTPAPPPPPPHPLPPPAPPQRMPSVPTPAPPETARSQPPSRAAPPPMVTAATKPAPGSTATARSEPASLVASEQPTSDTVAAAETTDAPAAAKKTHNKRKTVRHERPSRDFWNPMNFFAWGSNGARRSF